MILMIDKKVAIGNQYVCMYVCMEEGGGRVGSRNEISKNLA